ncbi:MAG: translocation/assembly module TamB [Cyclobacteriaceae bacterium]|nr:translocation/assembly module TamB [Cyclobacteriaceae bacterium]
MLDRRTIIRISKFLGKVVLGLLSLLFILVALVHVPPIQRKITHRLSNYLSSKIESRVEIAVIKFSLLGNVVIEDLKARDPNNNTIVSARKIEVTSNIFDLIGGDLIFDEVSIEGFDGHLIQGEEGLNIQFIIDAFRPKAVQAPSSKRTRLVFKRVILDNISFEFTSTINGTSVDINLGTFSSQDAEVSINPNKISAGKAYFENAVVNILSARPSGISSDTLAQENKQLLSPDFGTGLAIDVKAIEMKSSDFSFHRDEVKTTPKFDPLHLMLKNILISLSDISIREDTLAAALRSLSAEMPGFKLSDATADMHANRTRWNLSNLHLAADNNELNANLAGRYDMKSAKDDQAMAEISLVGSITPGNLAYFLSDSLMSHFNHWETTTIEFKGNYTLGKGEVKTFNLKTVNSQLHAEGVVRDALNPEKLSWNDVAINTSIGSDFNRTLTPFLQDIGIPPQVSLELRSSGNLKKAYVDGKVFTSWGDVNALGWATRQDNNVEVDIDLTGRKVDVGKFIDLPWLGPIDLSVGAKGILGNDPDIDIKGLIDDIVVLDQSIHKIAFQGRIGKAGVMATMSIDDPKYRSAISSEISFTGPLVITNDVQLEDFSLGRLLHIDSTLSISGELKTLIKADQSSIDGYLEGKGIEFQNQSITYPLDSMAFKITISPTASEFDYYTDFGKGKLTSNFDIRESPSMISTWSNSMLNTSETQYHPTGGRNFNFSFQWEKASPFQLLDINIDDFSALSVAGEFDEQKQALTLQAAGGKFKGYGISLDTLRAGIMALPDSVSGSMTAKNVFYNAVELGNLDFDVFNKGDTSITNLLLSQDSSSILGFRARVAPSDSGVFVYPDKLLAFDKDYIIDRNNPVYLEKGNIVLRNFTISRDDMRIGLDGDLKAFDVSIENVDLAKLNFLLFPDSTIVNKGKLNATASYSYEKKLNLRAGIDSLILYNSNPLTLTATVVSDKNQAPFEFLLANSSNKIDLNGRYFIDNGEVDAALLLDINNVEIFAFLVSGFIDEMKGAIKGEARISGPIQKPGFKGYLRFLDAGFTTSNPKLTFTIQDDIIDLNSSGLLLDNFTIYDQAHNPLTISGYLHSNDYKFFDYDLQLNSDRYILLNTPDSSNRQLRGLLVIGTNIKLTGNEKDTYVKANITVKDTTNLTYVMANDEIDLLKSEGIIDFIDPAQLIDSAGREKSNYFYDSLIAGLPEMNLNSTIAIEDNAALRVVIDEQSGDYIEASGAANLELGYDRTGNVSLSGNYTINKGVYRLSFYDLVKKNFNLVKGSSVNWSGSPENGDLDIKAVHTVPSNSIGLIGHEIGENEKSIYKRALDYQVGININGTVENPVVSFSLDLPKEEKMNYPVLANKLDRLKLPEYQSELNKQVFGLIVLGGFLPENSGSDINSSLIATTALSNSVNSLLASQLNRFASQYIKGVNIDVGIQSYSDYSAPGGKTQTAMDFRVSKSMMDDRLSFEIGGDFNINQDQSGANTGNKNYRGDIAIIYDLTGNGNKRLKLFNNETYDIIYQEIRNTGISLIFIKEFDRSKKTKDR